MSATSKVGPVAAAPTHPVEAAKPISKGKSLADPKVRKAAEEFEAMFVRQILSSAKIGGHDTESGYDGMAVDAIASAVTKGGGLGLSRQIEEAISRTRQQK